MSKSEPHTKYNVRQIENMSPAELSRAVEETTRAFGGDPTLGFIFRSPKELAQLVELNFHYYMKQGMVFGAFDESCKLQGVSLWNPPGSEPIGVKTVIMSGLLGRFFKILFHLRPDSFYRMIKMSDCTQEHQPKREHCYLYWIAAFRPGAGSALLEDALPRFQGHDLYLENSNRAKNLDFYQKFGFVPLPEIGWHGCAVLPMIRKKCVMAVAESD